MAYSQPSIDRRLAKNWRILCISNAFARTQHKYDTIRYDSVYLTCSKKLTGSQLSPLHGTKKIKSETKNKMLSVIGPVQSHHHEGMASISALEGESRQHTVQV